MGGMDPIKTVQIRRAHTEEVGVGLARTQAHAAARHRPSLPGGMDRGERNEDLPDNATGRHDHVQLDHRARRHREPTRSQSASTGADGPEQPVAPSDLRQRTT